MMTSTTPTKLVDILGESWVELGQTSSGIQLIERGKSKNMLPSPPCIAANEEYLRLLREAQRESNQSSTRVSVAGSSRHTPRGSPKSPPNSPNNELSSDEELKGYYINKELENTDWVWDWSSRPDSAPPKDWKFKHPSNGSSMRRSYYSIRHAKVGKTSLFSREVLYTLLLTNVLSVIIGTGIGVWLCRRSNSTLLQV